MYKNQLQELAQRSCFNLPCYACIREGPDHAPRFKASVNFNGDTIQSPFYSPTIRQAEHVAALAAITSLSSRCPSKSLTARILDETGIYKNLLQETAHRAGMKLPMYTTVRSGPGHVPVFTSTVDIAGISFKGDSGKTKKQAEKNTAIAAGSALKTMPHLSSLSRQSKETKTHEELDQAIVTSVLSNFRLKGESKLVKDENPNQERRSLYMTTRNRDKSLVGYVSRSPTSTPKGNRFPSILLPSQPKAVAQLPLASLRPISESLVKNQKVALMLDEHRRDEDQWLGGNSKAETTIALSKNSSYLRVSDSSSYGPITLLDHWTCGGKTYGRYNPNELRSFAPAVQVRSVIPVCATPPLLESHRASSSHSHPQPVGSVVSISSSAGIMSKHTEESPSASPKWHNPQPYSNQLSSSLFNHKLQGKD